ncbi:MAG: serine/threonine protein kinase, partial [Candidatus Riflebacteria bacterium]|nr:serine/threonine protein kinase [Candidatus Riflebacteria bacterium]
MSEDFSQKRAGNYTLVRKLGDGGFATVYLAQHTVLEKKAAVKLLLGEWVEEQDVVTRFFDEARTMESVSEHPNIVKIIDIATKEKCQEEGLPPYFIMEYLEGKSLEDIMKSTDGFTLEQIVKIMDSALSALQFCHDHGIVHRDIKPSNFMLDADGNVKLTDFGIAKAAENTSKTGEGLTLGSTDYMSPEQALGKRDLDYRSDIYSLGVTLYQLVCDRLPFIADSANAVALKHIQEKPVPPIDLNPDVPRRLNNII